MQKYEEQGALSTQPDEACTPPSQLLFPIDDTSQHSRPHDIPFALAFTALSSIRGLGRKTLRALCDQFGLDIGHMFSLDGEEIERLLQEAKSPARDTPIAEILLRKDTLLDTAAKRLEELSHRHIQLLSRQELPVSLQALPDPPRWLFIEGNPDILFHQPTVAVVGTRQPSAMGLEATRRVIEALAAYPITFVSGLAEGIDAEAHTHSLRYGVPNIAFLGHGVNIVFPSSTAGLRQEIIRLGGAVATEYLPNEHYQKASFVERNRLQAGLAQQVIPVEGRIKGGTTHTLRFARHYGRSIVGIEWPGAEGLVEDIRRDGGPIFNISTNEGLQALDMNFRALAERAGHVTNPLLFTMKFLEKEFSRRHIGREDIRNLVNWIRERHQVLGDELGDASTTGSDL